MILRRLTAVSDLGILKYRSDPRFAAFCRKLGLAVPNAEGQLPKTAAVGDVHD